MKQPVSVDKSGEVDAVNGTRAPVRKPDRASPKDLSKTFISLFRASFSRKLIMSSHLGSDSSVFINFYETFAVFPPWVTG